MVSPPKFGNATGLHVLVNRFTAASSAGPITSAVKWVGQHFAVAVYFDPLDSSSTKMIVEGFDPILGGTLFRQSLVPASDAIPSMHFYQSGFQEIQIIRINETEALIIASRNNTSTTDGFMGLNFYFVTSAGISLSSPNVAAPGQGVLHDAFYDGSIYLPVKTPVGYVGHIIDTGTWTPVTQSIPYAEEIYHWCGIGGDDQFVGLANNGRLYSPQATYIGAAPQWSGFVKPEFLKAGDAPGQLWAGYYDISFAEHVTQVLVMSPIGTKYVGPRLASDPFFGAPTAPFDTPSRHFSVSPQTVHVAGGYGVDVTGAYVPSSVLSWYVAHLDGVEGANIVRRGGIYSVPVNGNFIDGKTSSDAVVLNCSSTSLSVRDGATLALMSGYAYGPSNADGATYRQSVTGWALFDNGNLNTGTADSGSDYFAPGW
jgi:hypothetical protein